MTRQKVQTEKVIKNTQNTVLTAKETTIIQPNAILKTNTKKTIHQIKLNKQIKHQQTRVKSVS